MKLTYILIAINVILMSNAQAQPGTLDSTFSFDGIQVANFSTSADQGLGMAIQTDGKIVVVGSSFLNGSFDCTALRLLPDGMIDNTFDNDGKVSINLSNTNDIAYAVTIQSDGKIILAGHKSGLNISDFMIIRLNSNGSLDTSFGNAGIVTTDEAGNNDIPSAIALQPDGKILVAGHTQIGVQNDFMVCRYLTDGTLDSTFNANGKKIFPVGPNNDLCQALKLQADGKIVLAGNAAYPGAQSNNFATARLLPDGSLDTTFNSTGIAVIDFYNTDEEAYGLAIQNDGKILVGGYANIAGSNDFALLRLLPNGLLDSLFSNDGKQTTTFASNFDYGKAIELQPDGKILMAGFSTGGTNQFALCRFLSNGDLDSGFSADGQVLTSILNNTGAAAYAMQLQIDGKILLAGQSGINTTAYTIVRYNNTNFTGIESSDNFLNHLLVSPNPFDNYTIFSTSYPIQDPTITIFNNYGQKVALAIYYLAPGKWMIEKGNQPAGLYYVQIKVAQQIIGTARLVIY
ncbi:MAG: hypothetical protein RIQ89_2339 [Bacteroidota bacterium]